MYRGIDIKDGMRMKRKNLYIIDYNGVIVSHDIGFHNEDKDDKSIIGKSIFEEISFEGSFTQDGYTFSNEDNPIIDIVNKRLKESQYIVFSKNDDHMTGYYILESYPLLSKVNEINNTVIILTHVISSNNNINYLKSIIREKVLNLIDIPMAIVNYPKLNIVMFNNNFRNHCKNFLNRDPSDPLDDASIIDMVYDSWKDRLSEAINDALDSKMPQIIRKFSAYDENGFKIFYRLELFPFEYDKTGDVKLLIYAVDITKEINDGMAIESLSKKKDDYITSISHEIRTQLNLISSSIQLAQDVYKKDMTPDLEKVFYSLNNNCPKLLKLINNMLDISKAESGFLTLNNSNFDIVLITNQIVSSAVPYALEKGIELRLYCKFDAYYVYMDKVKYERILLNFLSNAIKYTYKGNNIQVFLRVEGEYLRITVSDEGIGIPRDKIPFIFNRFTMINDERMENEYGTGIGLELVKRFVSIMGGNVYVDSIEDEGSSFTVEFSCKNIKAASYGKTERKLENLKREVEIEFSDVKEAVSK